MVDDQRGILSVKHVFRVTRLGGGIDHYFRTVRKVVIVVIDDVLDLLQVEAVDHPVAVPADDYTVLFVKKYDLLAAAGVYGSVASGINAALLFGGKPAGKNRVFIYPVFGRKGDLQDLPRVLVYHHRGLVIFLGDSRYPDRRGIFSSGFSSICRGYRFRDRTVFSVKIDRHVADIRG